MTTDADACADETSESEYPDRRSEMGKSAGAVAVLLPGYACRCARDGCGYEWESRCECPVRSADAVGGVRNIHREGCLPPQRCPGCKAIGWERPAAWVPGEGTSREAVRRRNVATRERRGGRKR